MSTNFDTSNLSFRLTGYWALETYQYLFCHVSIGKYEILI